MTKEQYLIQLYEAYKSGQSLEHSIFPENIANLEEAYAVQHAFTSMKEADGEKLSGYKISLTSTTTQKMFNTNEPLYGQLTDKRVCNKLQLSNTSEPKIELELVFIASEDLSPEDSLSDILAKTKVAPGLEVPDSRYKNWFPNISKEHVCCDGAVGGWLSYAEAVPATFSLLDKSPGSLLLNGKEIAKNTSDNVLSHPVHAVAWLLKKLEQHKLQVKKGMFISSGTFVPPAPLERGIYEGRFGNFGSVHLEIT